MIRIREKDRYLVLGILVVMFLTLIFGNILLDGASQVDRNNRTPMEVIYDPNGDKKYSSESNNLIFSFDNGMLQIDGEGSITSDSVNNFLNKNDILPSDIENIIIGNNIYDVGYKAFYGLKYLQSIYFGQGVKFIRNGAVRECTDLRYVFLPEGLEKLSLDFGIGSDKIYIISNGEISHVFGGSRLDNAIIMENIKSYDDFIYNASVIEPYEIYNSNQLLTLDLEAGNNPMVLHQNYLQYGPYAELGRGEYTVEYNGDGLLQLSNNSVSIYTGEGGDIIEISNIRINTKKILYDFTIDKYENSVEFYLKNDSINAVQIEGIKLYKKMEAVPTIQSWWDK